MFAAAPQNALTYTGAYIPACEEEFNDRPSKGKYTGCPKEKFDFVNAFTGTLVGDIKFKKFGESVKEKLGLTKIGDLFSPPGKPKFVNPTLGSIHCQCDF